MENLPRKSTTVKAATCLDRLPATLGLRCSGAPVPRYAGRAHLSERERKVTPHLLKIQVRERLSTFSHRTEKSRKLRVYLRRDICLKQHEIGLPGGTRGSQRRVGDRDQAGGGAAKTTGNCKTRNTAPHNHRLSQSPREPITQPSHDEPSDVTATSKPPQGTPTQHVLGKKGS